VPCAINGSASAFSDEIDEVTANLDDANVEKIDLGTASCRGCDGHPDLALAAHRQSELGW
jgi:hypothetical protein